MHMHLVKLVVTPDSRAVLEHGDKLLILRLNCTSRSVQVLDQALDAPAY